MIMAKGMIFCHVIMIIMACQFIDWAIEGIQAWNGAAASLMKKAIINMFNDKNNDICVVSLFWCSCIMAAINMIDDAVAWIRKY